ncbi:MAG: hypothetical protein ABIR03_09210 [Ginsengibacter sp.]
MVPVRITISQRIFLNIIVWDYGWGENRSSGKQKQHNGGTATTMTSQSPVFARRSSDFKLLQTLRAGKHYQLRSYSWRIAMTEMGASQ